MDKQQQAEKLLDLMTALFETQGKTATPIQLANYCRLLADIPLPVLSNAIDQFLLTKPSGFVPSIAEIRQQAGQPSAKQESLTAWMVVLKTCHKLGYMKHVDYGPRTNAVIRSLGGWNNFLLRFDSAEGEKWLAKEFIARWEALSGPIGEEQGRYLAGESQVEPRLVRLIDPINGKITKVPAAALTYGQTGTDNPTIEFKRPDDHDEEHDHA